MFRLSLLASTDLADDIGAPATITIDVARDEHVDLLLEGSAVVVDLDKKFSFRGEDMAFRFDLQHLAEQISDQNHTLKELFEGASDLIDATASGTVDFSVDGRIDFRVGFDPTQNVGSAVFVTDDSQVTMDVLLDTEELNLDWTSIWIRCLGT